MKLYNQFSSQPIRQDFRHSHLARQRSWACFYIITRLTSRDQTTPKRKISHLSSMCNIKPDHGGSQPVWNSSPKSDPTTFKNSLQTYPLQIPRISSHKPLPRLQNRSIASHIRNQPSWQLHFETCMYITSSNHRTRIGSRKRKADKSIWGRKRHSFFWLEKRSGVGSFSPEKELWGVFVREGVMGRFSLWVVFVWGTDTENDDHTIQGTTSSWQSDNVKKYGQSPWYMLC